MQYGPDLSSDNDEEGFSDDPDYEDFMERMRRNRRIEHDSSNNNHEAKLRSISMAISLGRNETITDELNNGFDVDINLGDGWTPLLLASSVGNDFVVREVVQRGANVNSLRDACTPLLLACNIKIDDNNKNNVYNIVKILLDNGADVGVVDKRRRNALMLAAFNNNFEVVKLLLPLIDKDLEDNQCWTVVFWAIAGNAIDCVRFLLNENFDLSKTDLRDRTMIDVAREKGYEEIVDLLSVEQPYKYSPFIVDTNENFDNSFKTIDHHRKPQFLSDAFKILYATRCENLIPKFVDNNVSLFDLLTCNNTDLINYSIHFPYQRKRIMGGLYRLHKKSFNPKSIPVVKKNEICSNLDTAAVILTCTKQSLVMEASLDFVMKNYNDELPIDDREVVDLLDKLKNETLKLETLTNRLVERTRIWDRDVDTPDLIIKKRRNIPWMNLFVSTGVLLGATISVVFYKNSA